MNNQVLLGRTMDYGYSLDDSSVVALRDYHWTSHTGTAGQAQYGFVDTGTGMRGFICGGGVNEHDTAISTQYFRDYSSYGSTYRADAVDITQSETVTWILGYTTGIEDMKQQTSQIHVVAVYLNNIGEVPPLHYHVSGVTGHSAEILFKEGEVAMKDNPIGVLTNHPDLDWYYSNLGQYINISPYSATAKLLEGVSTGPLGNEAGTFGLPGGFTSTERLMRMTFMKTNIAQNNDKEMDLMGAFYLLDVVNILIGAVRPHDADNHYTMYQTAINLTTGMLYIKYHGSNEMVALKLTDDLVNREDMMVFKPEKHIAIRKLSDNRWRLKMEFGQYDLTDGHYHTLALNHERRRMINC